MESKRCPHLCWAAGGIREHMHAHMYIESQQNVPTYVSVVAGHVPAIFLQHEKRIIITTKEALSSSPPCHFCHDRNLFQHTYTHSMSLFYHNASLSILGIPYYEQLAHDEWNEQKVYDDLSVLYQRDNDHTRPWWWFQRDLEQEPVPPKKRSELEKSQKPPWDLWYSVSSRYPKSLVQTKHQSHFLRPFHRTTIARTNKQTKTDFPLCHSFGDFLVD